MHFRMRGNSAQIVKPVQDAASKKAVSKPVGSINIATGVLSDIAKENLSAEEITTVEAWLARKQDIERRKRQLDAETLPATIGNIMLWVRDANVDEVRVLADEILFSLKDLQAAINMKLREQA